MSSETGNERSEGANRIARTKFKTIPNKPSHGKMCEKRKGSLFCSQPQDGESVQAADKADG